MSKEKRNRMLEKVRALLNKGDTSRGSTPEEAAAAMAKAQELMTKHGIDMMDAQEIESESFFDIGHDDIPLNRGRRTADLYVTDVLSRCFGVQTVFSYHYRPGKSAASLKYVIMGDELDRELAKIALPVIYKTMTGGLSAFCTRTGVRWSVGVERDFCSGVRDGYCEASEEGKNLILKHLTKDQQEQFGLILVQKEALTVAYKEKLFPKLKTVSASKRKGSLAARVSGFATGSNMTLLNTKRIA